MENYDQNFPRESFPSTCGWAGNHSDLQPIYWNWKEAFESKPTITAGKEKSPFFQLPEGLTTELCETATHVLSRLLDGLKPTHSFPVHPLPPFAVKETIITASQPRT